MLRRTLMLALLAGPAFLGAACELVTPETLDKFAARAEDVDGDGGKEAPATCKPLGKLGEGCMKPHFADRDGDGCVDYYACEDFAGGGSDPACKPVDKLTCDGAEYRDTDGDGCIDWAGCPPDASSEPAQSKT